MQFLERFIERAPLIAADATVADAAGQLDAHPATPTLAVSDEGEVVGLIGRGDIDNALASGRGQDAVRGFMLRQPLVLDAGQGLAEAIRLILADPAGRDAFVCMDRGVYAGVGALRGLLADPSADLLGGGEAEFRVHVQGLLAMADRLGRQPLGPDAQAQVSSIVGAGQTLLRLVDDARDLLQARQGRLALHPSPQPLRALMDAVEARWAGRAAETGVSLLISYDGDPDLAALVDGARLAQVFDTLIEGALRHTRRGSVEAALRARQDEGRLLLEGRVRDTGSGLAAPRLGRLFGAGGGPDGEGAGLSLSLVRGIVLAMGGSIGAQGNAGEGITIAFDMMVDAVGAAAAARPAPVNGAPHVLVVDDNATNRMVAEALCEMFDCTCETAEDGVEAVEAARSGRFDLILMDIKMPRMDGVAATRAIRALGGAAGGAPIVALTANVDPEDARSYLAAGMCAVVEKPIKPDKLLQAMNAALASVPDEARHGAAA